MYIYNDLQFKTCARTHKHWFTLTCIYAYTHTRTQTHTQAAGAAYALKMQVSQKSQTERAHTREGGQRQQSPTKEPKEPCKRAKRALCIRKCSMLIQQKIPEETAKRALFI